MTRFLCRLRSHEAGRNSQAAWDQLPQDQFLLQASQVVTLAPNGGVGEHAAGFLKGGCGDPGVGRKDGFRQSQQHRLRRGRTSALGKDSSICLQQRKAIYNGIREQSRVAWLTNLHKLQHLAHNALDMLIIEVDARLTVDALYFVYQVAARHLAATDAQQILRMNRASGKRRSGEDLFSVFHEQLPASRTAVAAFLERERGFSPSH